MPDIGQPSETDKNSPNEIRDGVVSDATRFPGGFIDIKTSEAGAPVQILGQFQLTNVSLVSLLDVSSQESFPEGLTFDPSGNRLYLIGNGGDNIYQYSLSTPFGVSTASFVRSFDISSEDRAPSGVAIKPDGSELYHLGGSTSNIYQYDLTTDFDISTASLAQSFDVSPQDGSPEGLAFEDGGSRLYVTGANNTSVFQYSLSTAFDISTASFVRSLSVSTQGGNPTGVSLKPDGKQLFITSKTNISVIQYSLSTAFDISTASFVRSFDVSPQESDPADLALSPDGGRLYVVGSGSTNIFQYAVGIIGSTVE